MKYAIRYRGDDNHWYEVVDPTFSTIQKAKTYANREYRNKQIAIIEL